MRAAAVRSARGVTAILGDGLMLVPFVLSQKRPHIGEGAKTQSVTSPQRLLRARPPAVRFTLPARGVDAEG
jgi:hypothetical protein